MKTIILGFLGFWCTHLFAQSQIQVKSKWDEFVLQKSSSGYTLSGERIQSTHIDPLLKALSTPATAPCPAQFKATISLTVDGEVHLFNLDKGVLKGPKGCLFISGPGLDAFPVHRSWLIGPFVRNLKPKNSVQFKSQALTFQAKRNEEEWSLGEPLPTFNFEFLEQFLNSFKDFKVDRFIHLSSTKGKPSAQVVMDGKNLTLYQLGPITWAVRDGKNPWAMISSHWSIWKDLGTDQWTDPHHEAIQALRSVESSQEAKLEHLNRLGPAWSESLKLAYQNCLLSDHNSVDVRYQCLQKMRRRPTDSNFKTVIQMITNEDNHRLLKAAADFLRIKNPKGPKFSEKMDPEQFRKEWRSWWAGQNR